MGPERSRRSLVAVMFTDVVGYTGPLVAACLTALAVLGFWLGKPTKVLAASGDEETFSVALAPFAAAHPESLERSRLISKLVEGAIRERADTGILELRAVAQLPVEREEDAASLGEEFGADAVLWGTVLGAGEDAEVEAHILLLNALDRVPSARVSASLIPDPHAMVPLIRGLALDAPGELTALRMQAGEIADLATTLAGLAKFRSGEYEAAAEVLGSIADPTPDQLFYRALALLRAGERSDAAGLFEAVLAQSPSHPGAQLGLIAARGTSANLESLASVVDLMGNLEQVERFDPRILLLSLYDAAAREGHPEEAGEAILSRMSPVWLRQLELLCRDSDAKKRYGQTLPLLVGEWVVSEAIPFVDGEIPAVPPDRPDLVDCARSNPDAFAIICALAAANAAPLEVCENWNPDSKQMMPIVYFAHLVAPFIPAVEEGGGIDQVIPDTIRQRLFEAARQDPALDQRRAEWLSILRVSGIETSRLLEWVDSNLGTGAIKGRNLVARGSLLKREKRFEEALASLDAAAEILRRDEELVDLRTLVLLALDRAEEAAEYVDAKRPFAPYAYAAAGRLREAIGLELQQDAHVFAFEDNPRPPVSRLERVMELMTSEVEAEPAIHEALTEVMRSEIWLAAREPMGSFYFGLDIDTEGGGFSLEVVHSLRADLRYDLPTDPFSLEEMLRELPRELTVYENPDWDEAGPSTRRLQGRSAALTLNPTVSEEQVGDFLDRLLASVATLAANQREPGARSLPPIPNATFVALSMVEREEVEPLLRSKLEANPDDGRSLVQLGALLLIHGESGDAVALLERAVKLEASREAQWLLVRAYTEASRLEEARTALERYLRANPEDTVLRTQLAEALEDERRYDEAAALLERAIEIDPHEASLHYILGRVRRQQASYGEAERSQRRALELDPQYAWVHRELGQILYDQSLYEMAIPHFRKASELDDQEPEFLSDLAWALEKSGEYADAETALERALELAPDEWWIHHRMGRVHRLQREYDEAERSLKRAIELEPDSASTHFELGLVYDDQALYEQAIPRFRRATELAADTAAYWGWLGHALEGHGDYAEAKIARKRQRELGSAAGLDRLIESHRK